MEVLQVTCSTCQRTGLDLTAAMPLGLAAVLLLSACDLNPGKFPKLRLEGSLGQVMDTGYDEVRVGVASTDISITFVRIFPLSAAPPTDGGEAPQMLGTREDFPLKVAYRLLGEPLSAGRIDLAALDMNGVQRGIASRSVANDPRNVLPLILRGTVKFDRPLDPGATVNGDFNITFENGIDAASGRTVFATSFSAKVPQP